MEPTNTNLGHAGANQTATGQSSSSNTKANQAGNTAANRGSTQDNASFSGAQNQNRQTGRTGQETSNAT